MKRLFGLIGFLSLTAACGPGMAPGDAAPPDGAPSDSAPSDSPPETGPSACGTITCGASQVCVEDTHGGGVDAGGPGPSPSYSCVERSPQCEMGGGCCTCSFAPAACSWSDPQHVRCIYG